MDSEAIDASLDSLELDRARRQSQIERLRHHAQQLGYDIPCDVKEDGDCFFHSIAYHLRRSETESRSLRHELHHFMQSKVNFTSLQYVTYFLMLYFSESTFKMTNWVFSCFLRQKIISPNPDPNPNPP